MALRRIGKILRIHCKTSDDVYISGTFMHIGRYIRSASKLKRFDKNYDGNDYNYDLLKKFRCTKIELRREVQKYVNREPSTLNKRLIYLTLNKKKEMHKEAVKKYREKINKYITCECGIQLKIRSLLKHKMTKIHEKLFNKINEKKEKMKYDNENINRPAENILNGEMKYAKIVVQFE